MARYLVINLTKASPPRSTESTRSAAPLPVITKRAFLICRPRVWEHKQFALRKVPRRFWILIKSWLMLLCVKECMWSECSETTHWGSECSRCKLTYEAFIGSKRGRQRRPLIRVAWRGKGLLSCWELVGLPQIFWQESQMEAPPPSSPIPPPPRPSERNKQWRRSCQHPNCLEVLHLLALDGPVHCKHTWSAELDPVNCVLKAEFTQRRLTPGCEKVNLVPFLLSAALPRELSGNCLSAPWRQVDGHCDVQSSLAQLCTF